MANTWWRKVWRDMALDKMRTAMMVAAIAVSVFGVGVVLGGYSILTREITRNYLDTRPATATFDVGNADDELVRAVQNYPGVSEAEARDSLDARALVGDDWLPVRLFVVADFADMRLNVPKREAGEWPPPDGTVVVERTSPTVLQAGLGDTLVLKTPNGTPARIHVSAVVHDPSLAPAWQDQTGYVYLSRATVASLGEEDRLGELRVEFEPSLLAAGRIDTAARGLGR